MVITYHNTKEELLEVNKFIIKNRLLNLGLGYHLYKFRYIGFLYFICIYIMSYSKIHNHLRVISIFLVVSFAIYFFIDTHVGSLLNKSMDKFIHDKPEVLQRRSVFINESVIEITCADKVNHFNISSICKTSVNKHTIYVFFEGYWNYLVVPYSCFGSEEDLNDFIKKLGVASAKCGFYTLR